MLSRQNTRMSHGLGTEMGKYFYRVWRFPVPKVVLNWRKSEVKPIQKPISAIPFKHVDCVKKRRGD